jgi:monoamine oxidase
MKTIIKKIFKTKNKTKKRKTREEIEEYDIIVLGGGIAGIYTIYKLMQYSIFSQKRILLLEKTERLGGRVYSIHPYKNHPEDVIEGGAGRFSQTHIYLNKLINELNLENKIKQNNSNTEYYPINPIKISQKTKTNELLLKVIKNSKKENVEYLRTISFSNYAREILSSKEIQYIQDSFGYYSELVIMNTYDAIQLISNLDDTNNHFYSLNGGLSQINERMIDFVVKKNKEIFQINQNIQKISQLPKEIQEKYLIETQNKKYITKIIISALPKQILERISFFKPLNPLLSKIKCAPLCRIYSRYPKEKNIWFENLSKITTNNHLRMVIPINKEKGIIMISYTDNKFADYWYRKYKKEGISKINERLKEEIKQSTGIIIPKEPIQTNIYYWKCGVGYWGLGANSQEISQRMIQPFIKKNIFCCGEHYSEKFQQWIEGALETSEKVLKKIIERKI